MSETVTHEYCISIYAADGDFVYFERVATAPVMEDRVTALHKEYSAPHFRVDVRYR